MSYPLHHLGTSNREVGRGRGPEPWLIREFDAVLRAYGHYARSLPDGTLRGGAFGGDGAGVVDGIGMLGVLAGMESPHGVAAEDEDSDDRARRAGSTSLRGARSRPRWSARGTVAASEDDDGRAHGRGRGAPLLGPIADALRAVGTRRESLGRRVGTFPSTPCASSSTISERCPNPRPLRPQEGGGERAREHYLSRTTELARGKAQDTTAAKENLRRRGAAGARGV